MGTLSQQDLFLSRTASNPHLFLNRIVSKSNLPLPYLLLTYLILPCLLVPYLLSPYRCLPYTLITYLPFFIPSPSRTSSYCTFSRPYQFYTLMEQKKKRKNS